ncbi:MAG: hypothetical protein CMH55_03255, partial [Myxococcales bacterium]|nr:hypothetical protein [Myxococcales bacterium]
MKQLSLPSSFPQMWPSLSLTHLVLTLTSRRVRTWRSAAKWPSSTQPTSKLGPILYVSAPPLKPWSAWWSRKPATRSMTTTSTEASEAPRLICDDLQIGWGAVPLLPALSFSVSPGSVWVLVGRNGSGKSTLLHTLLGALKPLGGHFSLNDGSSIAHVPQRGSHDLCVPARAWDMVEAG